MDTSEKYIKMCQKATEIQGRSEFQAGDDIYWARSEISAAQHLMQLAGVPNSNFAPIKEGIYTAAKPFLKTKSDIWLPRQDQLQEMIEGKIDGTPTFIGWELVSFYNFVFPRGHKIGEPYHLSFSSMEQLWLAFVMKECYNKVWLTDKNEWVSQSVSSAQNAKRSEV